MRDYQLLSIAELCEKFAIYDDERYLIEDYVGTLSEEEQAEFNDFRTRNAVGLGLEPSPFEDIKASDIFMMKERNFIVYDQYGFDHYRYYVDELLKSYDGQFAHIKGVLADELAKCEGRLKQLQAEAQRIYKKADLDKNLASRHEVEKCIEYLTALNSLPPELLFKEKFDPRLANLKVVIRALFYCYLQEAGHRPTLKESGLKKKDFANSVAPSLGASPNSFNQLYDLANNPRTRLGNIKKGDLIALLPFLEQYPGCTELAKADLLKLS